MKDDRSEEHQQLVAMLQRIRGGVAELKAHALGGSLTAIAAVDEHQAVVGMGRLVGDGPARPRGGA